MTKTLLLKTPHPLVAEHRETRLGLSWKLPSHWLSLMVSKGAIHCWGRVFVSSLTQLGTFCALRLHGQAEYAQLVQQWCD